MTLNMVILDKQSKTKDFSTGMRYNREGSEILHMTFKGQGNG